MPTSTLYGPDNKRIELPKAIQQKTLSLHEADIYRRIVKWEASRNLESTLVCRHCYRDFNGNIEKATITVALTPNGGLIAACRCSRWETA